MVKPIDYLGKSFGDFEITQNIAHGAEAEVYTCLHKTTGRFYILRLGVNDDDLWEHQPVVPPVNYTCEFADAKQILLAQLSAKQTYEFGVERFLRGDTTIQEVDRYGILDNRYLVPVDAAVTTKHSWDIDRLLKEARADDLFLFELWEEIVLSMMSEAHLANESAASEQKWVQKWGNLAGGEILKAAIAHYLNNGQLTRKEKENVLARVSEKHIEGPELAENLLLRIAGCLSRRKMSANEVMGTLLCHRFRINVTWHELTQIVDVYNILRGELLPGKSLKLLEFMIGPLSQQPFDKFKDHEAFVSRIKETRYGEYQTILQEYAGTHQDCPSLSVTKT